MPRFYSVDGEYQVKQIPHYLHKKPVAIKDLEGTYIPVRFELGFVSNNVRRDSNEAKEALVFSDTHWFRPEMVVKTDRLTWPVELTKEAMELVGYKIYDELTKRINPFHLTSITDE